MRYQKVKYKLINKDTGQYKWLSDFPQNYEESLYPAPRNWDEADKTLKRSEKTFGVYTELSKNLEFTKQAAQFLKAGYLAKDIEANFELEEWRFHPQTEVPYLHSTGVFDFSEYSYKNKIVKVPFKTGGLNSLIQSKLNEKFQLERTEAINGNIIDELDTKTVALTSREIFLISELETKNTNSLIIYSGVVVDLSRNHRLPFPMEIVSNSDSENIVQPIAVSDENIVSITGDGQVSEMFFLKSDVNKLDVNINYNVEFKIGTDTTWMPGVTNRNLHIKLKRFNNGDSFNYVEDLVEFTINDFTAHQGETYTYSGEITTDIAIDESISFVAEMSGSYLGVNGRKMWCYLEDIDCSIRVEEDSTREDSQTKTILKHEAGEKLMQIITGEKGRYYSDFYGRTDLGYNETGEFAYTGLTLGLWIRQFLDEKLEYSLKNFFETSRAVHATGYTIELKNGVETLVHEDLKYFFQNFIAIRLPNQVSNLERKAAKDFCHSTLEFGYKKPSNKEGSLYEEAMGLDEYNTQTGYTTNLTRVDTKYSELSDARADSYGKEFARRKPKLNYPEEDTRYDKDVFILDLKTGLGEALEERTWQDDFEQAPTGVYSPNTATGLRLTPFRCSERHQWFYGAGLFKHQNEKVRFTNSVGNSELSTKKAGETAKAENGDLFVSDLERPRFANQWITFEHPVDYDINNQVYGKTLVNGREVPNYFGLVEFINEDNQKEYGFLFELKPNKEGKWKILKAL